MYLARLLVDRGKPEDALPLSEQALSIWMATAPKSSSATAQAHAIHAYVLAHLGRSREAADELSAAVPMLLSARGPRRPAVRRRAELVEPRAAPRGRKTREPAAPSCAGTILYAGFSVSSLYAYCSSFKCREEIRQRLGRHLNAGEYASMVGAVVAVVKEADVPRRPTAFRNLSKAPGRSGNSNR